MAKIDLAITTRPTDFMKILKKIHNTVRRAGK